MGYLNSLGRGPLFSVSKRSNRKTVLLASTVSLSSGHCRPFPLKSPMEIRRSFLAALGLILSSLSHGCSLSITLSHSECLSETVHFEGDTVSGYFVVIDHDIFWGSDHPGIEFTVCPFLYWSDLKFGKNITDRHCLFSDLGRFVTQ